MSAPTLGLYTCIKSRKKLYKIRLQRDFFWNLQQMTEVTRGFCWHKNFVPWDCLPLPCGHIHLLNHEKMYIKSEVEEILFKLATNDYSDEPSCWHQKFGPNGLSAHAQGAMFKLRFLNNRWFKPILSTQESDTGPMVLWFKILYNFEDLKFHLLLKFYCISWKIYHRPISLDDPVKSNGR